MATIIFNPMDISLDGALPWDVTQTRLDDSRFTDLSEIDDASGNEMLEFDTVASAVNYFRFANSATGNDIVLSSQGDDANVDIAIHPKGTGIVTLQNTDAGASGSFLSIYHNSASPANSDVVGHVDFDGNDSGAAFQTYGRIEGIITDVTAASEDGDIRFSVVTAGTLTRKLLLDSDLAGIVVGTGAANAVVTSGGAFDLVLNTNNGTTSSNITITDAVAGAVTVNLQTTAQFVVANTDAGATGATLVLQHTSASPANSDVVGSILFNGVDDAIAAEAYGSILATVTDVTAANPDSSLAFQRDVAGTLTTVLSLNDSIVLTPNTTGSVQVAGARGITSSVTGVLVPFFYTAAQNAIAAGVGGAISVVTHLTTISVDAGGDAFTLAVGNVIGQIKKIKFEATAGGTGVVTAAFRGASTTLTFTNAGEFAVLMWDGTDWLDIELASETSNTQEPVLT